MKLATPFSCFMLLGVSLAAPLDSRQEGAAYTIDATREITTGNRPRALTSSPLPTAMNATLTTTVPHSCVTTISNYFRGLEPIYHGYGTCLTYATTTTETRYLKCDGLCSVTEMWRFRDHGPVVNCREWVTVPTKTVSTTLCTTAPITGDVTTATLPSLLSLSLAVRTAATATATGN